MEIVQAQFPDQMNEDDDYVFGVENLLTFCKTGFDLGAIWLLVLMVVGTLLLSLVGARVHAAQKIKKFQKEQKKMMKKIN